MSRRSLAFGPESLLIFLTMLPVTGVVPILKLFVMDGYGANEFQTHLFLSFSMVSAFLFAPLVGAWADHRGNRRRLIMFAALADALCFALMPFAPSYTMLMVIRFVEGIAHISALSLLLALAGYRAEHNHSAAMGAAGAVLTLGIALGSPLGGVLGELSPAYTLLAGAAIMIVVAMLSLTLLPGDTVPLRALPSRRIFSTLFTFPALRLPFVFAFLDRFTVGFLVAAFPIYATTHFGFTPSRIGLHFAAFMLTMGLLCYPVTRLSRFFTLRQLILGGSLIYSMLFSAVGFIGAEMLIWWMILMGAAAAVMFIPTLQLAARAVPDWARATAMGGLNACGALGFLSGPIVSGVLIASLKTSLGSETAYALILFMGGLTEFLIAGALLVFGWLNVSKETPQTLAQEQAPA